MKKKDQIYETKLTNPDMTNRTIAEYLNVSRRYVRKLLNFKKEKKLPKILIFDVETSMMEVFVWGIYKQRIPVDNIISDWFCFSWSAKWLFNSEIMSDVLTPEEALAKDDKRIMKSIWELVDEADILLGHNSNRFDIRKLNMRFIKYGFMPPSSYQTIDTLKVAKKHFAFSSYKLDYLTKTLGIGQKISTDYSLWKKCYKGDPKALKQMEEYNKMDTVITEDLYVLLRPWITSHPNLALYVDTTEEICPNCMSDDLDWKGKYYTPAGRFLAFRCKGCSAIGRSRYSDLSKEERLRLAISIAR